MGQTSPLPGDRHNYEAKTLRKQHIQRFLWMVVVAPLVLLLVASSCAFITGSAITPPPLDISVNMAHILIEFNEGNNDFIILDVRTPEEYAEGHLKGSLLINVRNPNFREEVDILANNATYLVYCRSGMRSAEASDIMIELGFKNLYNMTGGILDWQAAGFPTVQ